MYRQRTAETETGDQFVDRLYDLPVVNSAIGKLGALYTGTKEHNRLFRFTLQTAESGLGLVVSTARPVVAKFEKPIGALNGMAVHQLEKLEHDYPIITKPTDVVFKQTMDTYSSAVKPITDRVKPITDRVGQVTQYGVSKYNDAKTSTVDTISGVASYGVAKVNGVKSYGVAKVNDVKTYGVNKITSVTDMGSKQVSRLLDNHTGRVLVEKMDLAINLADGYVDRYLPEDVDCSNSPCKANKLEVDEAGEMQIAYKAMQLGRKVRRRAYVNVAKRLKMVKLRSLETVDKLTHTVDLMEYARQNLDGVKNKVSYVWEEINKSPDALDDAAENEKNVKNLTYERRAIATARHLAHRLKASLGGLNLSMDVVPSTVRTQVDRATDIAQSIYQTFSSKVKTGLSNDDFEGIRQSLGHLRTTLLSIVAYLPFSSLILPEEKSRSTATDQTEDATKRRAKGSTSTPNNDYVHSRQPSNETRSENQETGNTEHRDDSRNYDHDSQENNKDLEDHNDDSCEHNQ